MKNEKKNFFYFQNRIEILKIYLKKIFISLSHLNSLISIKTGRGKGETRRIQQDQGRKRERRSPPQRTRREIHKTSRRKERPVHSTPSRTRQRRQCRRTSPKTRVAKSQLGIPSQRTRG